MDMDVGNCLPSSFAIIDADIEASRIVPVADDFLRLSNQAKKMYLLFRRYIEDSWIMNSRDDEAMSGRNWKAIVHNKSNFIGVLHAVNIRCTEGAR